MAAADLHQDILDHHDKVLIIDFGSQVTQLIARRVREAGRLLRDRALPGRRGRLRDDPTEGGDPVGRSRPPCWTKAAPRAPQAVFEAGIPVLGICYGQQLMAAAARRRGVLQATTASSAAPTSRLRNPRRSSPACGSEGQRYPVWMSHGDR